MWGSVLMHRFPNNQQMKMEIMTKTYKNACKEFIEICEQKYMHLSSPINNIETIFMPSYWAACFFKSDSPYTIVIKSSRCKMGMVHSLLHEMGHYLNLHMDERNGIQKNKSEQEADEFAEAMLTIHKIYKRYYETIKKRKKKNGKRKKTNTKTTRRCT